MTDSEVQIDKKTDIETQMLISYTPGEECRVAVVEKDATETVGLRLLPDVLRGLHFLVFAMLMLPKAVPLLTGLASS